MPTYIRSLSYPLILTSLLVLPGFSWAEQHQSGAVRGTPPEEVTVSSDAGDESDQALVVDSEKEADKRREAILAKATEALEETEKALKALEEERIDDALAALATTTGKLELIIAREPELALAATDVSVTFRDILAPIDSIERTIDVVEDALDDGRIQDARYLLSGLGSEIVTTVTELPLATYPAAIKEIAPLIDAGEIERAKQELRAVLQTTVLTDYVTPLPYLRAEALLEEAEVIATKSERSDGENEELTSKLDEIRTQLDLGQLLGYGGGGSYESLHTQLNDIEKKTSNGKHGKGFFDEMKQSMSELWSSIRS